MTGLPLGVTARPVPVGAPAAEITRLLRAGTSPDRILEIGVYRGSRTRPAWTRHDVDRVAASIGPITPVTERPTPRPRPAPVPPPVPPPLPPAAPPPPPPVPPPPLAEEPPAREPAVVPPSYGPPVTGHVTDFPNLLATREDAYVAVLPASTLFIDHAYQRDLSQGRVNKLVREFSPRLFGLLEVSDRGEGHTPARYAVVAGQHRLAAAIAHHDDPDVPLAVRVHEGLTVADEAALMNELDRGARKLGPYDRWKARRVAGDPVVAEIERIAATRNLRMIASPAPGGIAATAAVEGLYRTGDTGLVDAVLLVLHGAWGDDQAAYTAPLLNAVGLLVHTHAERIDLDRLTAALRRTDLWSIRSTAHGYKEQRMHTGSLTQLIAAAMTDRYNRTDGAGGRLPALG